MTNDQRNEFWKKGLSQLEMQVEQARVNLRLQEASLKALEAELLAMKGLCEEGDAD